MKPLYLAALNCHRDPLMDLITEKIRAAELESEEVAELFIVGKF